MVEVLLTVAALGLLGGFLYTLVVVIEECEEEELSTRERYWIEKLNPPLNGGRAAIGWKGWELLNSIENPQ